MKPMIEALIDAAQALDGHEKVADIRVGLGYTAVKLESGKAGVAALLRHRVGKGTCSLLPEAGTLAGIAAGDAAALCRSGNVVEASIGLAAVNALIDWKADMDASNDELVDLLHIHPDDRIGMVGHIAPVAAALRRRTDACFVFDDGKDGRPGITATDREDEILPTCDVLILSATSLLNHSFERLLARGERAREICVMGPSTPLLPDLFRERGVTLLAGRQITDPDQILRIVSEAGGTRSFGRVSRKVTIELKQQHCDGPVPGTGAGEYRRPLGEVGGGK